MTEGTRPQEGPLSPPDAVSRAATMPLAPQELWLAVTPYLLLLVARLLSWGWHAAGARGAIGSTEPPSLVAMALLVVGGAWAFQRRLPPRLYAWGALGLYAVAVLAQAVIVGVAGRENNEAALGIPVLILLVSAIGTAVAVAGRGVRHGVLFFVLFQTFPLADFPMVSTGDFVSNGESLALTAGVAAVAACQTGLAVWLVRRFLRTDPAGQTQAVALLALLMLLYAAAISWTTLFTVKPEDAGATYASTVVYWVIFNMVFLALVYAIGRMRLRWTIPPR